MPPMRRHVIRDAMKNGSSKMSGRGRRLLQGNSLIPEWGRQGKKNYSWKLHSFLPPGSAHQLFFLSLPLVHVLPLTHVGCLGHHYHYGVS